MITNITNITNITKIIIFRVIELIGFLLPAIPESFITRIFILTIYFVAHTLGLPTYYMNMKKEFIYADHLPIQPPIQPPTQPPI